MPTMPYRTHSRDDSLDLHHPLAGLSAHSPDSILLPSSANSLSATQPSLSPCARFDAQKEIRTDWIETQCRYLEATARAVADAKRQYELTDSAADREVWLRAQELSQKAWSLDRLMEEQPSPSSRARLDAKKEIRTGWIETQCRYLAATARAVADAKRQYELTDSAADCEAWLRAVELSLEAWSLDQLTEQRRNLTMPDGMRALRVEPGGLASDARGGKEGGVLGFKIALMERVCAEAVAKKDECTIEAECLTESAKKAVRKAVMNDVARGVDRMLRRKMQKGGAEGDADRDSGVQSVEHQP
jgi:hypothetical protein